jgi:glycerol-3-phosphate dehydrogenase (NAD(P)+)
VTEDHTERATLAEDVHTKPPDASKAQRLGVDMPIVAAVYKIIYEALSPRDAIKKLMTRELKDEMEAMTETW